MGKPSVQGLVTFLLVLAVFPICSSRSYGDEDEFQTDKYPSRNGIDDSAPSYVGTDFIYASRQRDTLFQWGFESSDSNEPNPKEQLATDHPIFTQSSTTVGKGVAQIESAYIYTYENYNYESTKSHSFGNFLFRYGILAEWLELRIGFLPYQEGTTIGQVTDNTAGTRDLYTGLKIALTPQKGFLPEMALTPQMNIPSGNKAFTSNNLEPGLYWTYWWTINDFISTAGSTQGNRWIDDVGEGYLEIGQSWLIRYSLTKELKAYTEWYAIIPHGTNKEQTEHYFSGRLSYYVHNDMQISVFAAVGLNEAAFDYFIGTRFTIRFRPKRLNRLFRNSSP